MNHVEEAAAMPGHMRLSPEDQQEFDAISAAARVRHEKERKAAKARGRHAFPDSPYEGSWAHEEEFRRSKRKDSGRPHYHGHPLDDRSVRLHNEFIESGLSARSFIEENDEDYEGPAEWRGTDPAARRLFSAVCAGNARAVTELKQAGADSNTPFKTAYGTLTAKEMAALLFKEGMRHGEHSRLGDRLKPQRDVLYVVADSREEVNALLEPKQPVAEEGHTSPRKARTGVTDPGWAGKHVTHAARKRLSRTCSPHDLSYGGKCMNCGFDPEPEAAPVRSSRSA